MQIDASVVEKYLSGGSDITYADHWVFNEIEPGNNVFAKPDKKRTKEVEECYEKVIEICDRFSFLNDQMINDIFGDIQEVLEGANIILTVGMPPMYDAMVRTFQGEMYVILDLINFSDYVAKEIDINDIIIGMLSHEFIHLLINKKYPADDLSYEESLNYIAFHEGFAHLLSYKEDLNDYQADDEIYEKYFKRAKKKLSLAVAEKDPLKCEVYLFEANAGNYWGKFAAIASKLYLLKHIDSLKQIYNDGWQSYIDKVVNYDWD